DLPWQQSALLLLEGRLQRVPKRHASARHGERCDDLADRAVAGSGWFSKAHFQSSVDTGRIDGTTLGPWEGHRFLSGLIRQIPRRRTDRGIDSKKVWREGVTAASAADIRNTTRAPFDAERGEIRRVVRCRRILLILSLEPALLKLRHKRTDGGCLPAGDTIAAHGTLDNLRPPPYEAAPEDSCRAFLNSSKTAINAHFPPRSRSFVRLTTVHLSGIVPYKYCRSSPHGPRRSANRAC